MRFTAKTSALRVASACEAGTELNLWLKSFSLLVNDSQKSLGLPALPSYFYGSKSSNLYLEFCTGVRPNHNERGQRPGL